MAYQHSYNSMGVPEGMRLVRQSVPIETTTFSDEQPTYITRDVLVPIKHGASCICSYCSRLGTYASQCAGCGAQVR
jgi:hypothetical protein